MARKKVLVIHGPNINTLGVREPEIYGRTTFADLNNMLTELANKLEIDLEIFQSNHEGALIDKIQEVMRGTDGILINPGGLAHTSITLKDALSTIKKYIVEVHISNTYRREEYRHLSYVSAVANAVIVGFGIDSYLLGLRGLVRMMGNQ